MNYDPQVRAAYEHFYNLDYPGAVARFRAVSRRPSRRSAGHGLSARRAHLSGALPPGPARHHLLRQRRFSHRPPRHRGGPRRSATRSSPWPTKPCARPTGASARIPTTSTRSLPAPGCAACAAPTWPWWSAHSAPVSASPPRPRTMPQRVLAARSRLRRRQARSSGVYEYVVGALPWPFKLLIGFAGITGSKATGLAHAARRRQSRRHHQR